MFFQKLTELDGENIAKLIFVDRLFRWLLEPELVKFRFIPDLFETPYLTSFHNGIV